MNRWIKISWCLGALSLLAFVALPGCNQGKTQATKTDKTTKAAHLDYGPHGGPCAEWGDEDYHAEFTVDAAKKKVICYILDGDAKAKPKIDPAKIIDVKVIILETKPITIDLKYDAAASGDSGFAFTGEHEKFAKPEGMKVEIRGKVDGKPFNGEVTYQSPKKTARLYLTPGGIYTAADIKANGTMTAAEKFKGRDWSGAHDDNVKPGDKICPVSKSKATPDCTWTVQGQRYEFCCPPCVDSFINWAHFDSKRIKNADEYVKKDL